MICSTWSQLLLWIVFHSSIHVFLCIRLLRFVRSLSMLLLCSMTFRVGNREWIQWALKWQIGKSRRTQGEKNVGEFQWLGGSEPVWGIDARCVKLHNSMISGTESQWRQHEVLVSRWRTWHGLRTFRWEPIRCQVAGRYFILTARSRNNYARNWSRTSGHLNADQQQ